MLSQGFVSAAAIAASVLFILSLGGLSNQEKAKRAVWYGIVGMAIAVFFTALGPGIGGYGWLIPMVIIGAAIGWDVARSEEHTSELQSRGHLVCRLLLEKKKNQDR